jgi:hypothetical protein
MGLFDRMTKKDLRNDGLSGTAFVRSTRRDETEDGTFDPNVRSWPYALELDVRVEGRGPYTLTQKFKIPGAFVPFARGVELPVLVDAQKPDRILIDWDAFAAAGGEQIVEQAYEQRRVDVAKEVVSENSVHRSNSQIAVTGWLGAVRAGAMTIDEFESYVDEYVTAGMMTTEDGDAAKAQAAG